MFDKWIEGGRDSEEFSVSGIFWILLDMGRLTPLPRKFVDFKAWSPAFSGGGTAGA